MQFQIDGRVIGQNYTQLGVQGDHHVERVEFCLPRWYHQIDLLEGIPYLLYSLPDGESGFLADLDVAQQGDSLVIGWPVGGALTAQPGILTAALQVCGLDGELWHSEPTFFVVAKTLSMPKEQAAPLRESRAPLAAPEQPPMITVAQRQLIIPQELRSIAVQNDENSQTALVRLPRFFNGEDLCTKSVFLKTISSGGRDDVHLGLPDITAAALTFRWTLGPPQTSHAGRLTLQLAILGETQDGGQPFKWESEAAGVHILPSLDAAPAQPVEPSVMDGFLQQLSAVAARAQQMQQQVETSVREALERADNLLKTMMQSSVQIKILGIKPTLAQLEIDVPHPQPGDLYGVGESRVDAYIFDGGAWVKGPPLGLNPLKVEAGNIIFSDAQTLQEKLEYGQLSGPQGPAGPKGENGAQGERGEKGEKGERGDLLILAQGQQPVPCQLCFRVAQ